MNNTGSPGFTLLELLVVLAIMGLMLLIAMPFASRTIDNAALRSDAREMAGELRRLQQRAIDTQQTISLTSLSDDARLGVSFASSRRRHVLVSVPRGANVVVFYPDGTTSGGVLRLDESGRAMDIEVAWMTGAITLRTVP